MVKYKGQINEINIEVNEPSGEQCDGMAQRLSSEGVVSYRHTALVTFHLIEQIILVYQISGVLHFHLLFLCITIILLDKLIAEIFEYIYIAKKKTEVVR